MAEILAFPPGRAKLPAMGDGRPPDWREREQALDVQASWIVEAPAGSGKTGLLIQRYLKLLAHESVDAPEQVLAITFTNKATAEMRERVLDQLEAAAAGAPVHSAFDRDTRALADAVLRRDRAAGWGLMEQPRRLKIRTIDSLCAEISSSLPVLSGTGGRLSPTLESDALYQEAARRTLLQLGGDDRALHEALGTLLRHRDGNLAECERLIARILPLRDQWGTLVPLDGAELADDYLDTVVLPRLERALELAICQGLTQLTRTMPASTLGELTEAAAEFAHLDGYKGGLSPISFCKTILEPPEDRAEHLAHWRALVHLVVTPSTGTWRKLFSGNILKFDTGKSHQARLKAIVAGLQANDELLQAMCRLDKLPPARYPAEQWVVAKALFRVLSRALVELQLVFAARGACDFAELGLAARAALSRDSGAEDLTAALGIRIRHLLVDEVQDTSTSQYDLIHRLTHGWDGRSQTIFLVGDPKQSIYRFRQARVERFVRTMHEQQLGGLPLGCLRLTANFRSQRRLVEQFNEDFSRIFPAAIDIGHPEEVPFVAASAVREATRTDGLAWHTQVLPAATDAMQKRRNRRRQAADDALAIREIAMQWLGRPLPPGRQEPWRIAVLVRSRARVASIIAAFQRDEGEGAVPFRAVEIEVLGERQEVLDLLGLLRALVHPADRAAWFAVLHAPWCGLDLADLHELAGADDFTLRETCVADLIRERGHLLSDDGEQRLARVWPILEAAAAQRNRMTVAQWVERTWRSLGGDTYLETGQLANAMRFFRLLDEIEVSGRVDPVVLKQRMARLYAAPAVHPGAVDLMTIHGAKGLEWDVVLLPALEAQSAQDTGYLLNWMEVDSSDADASPVVLAPITGSGKDNEELICWIRSVHKSRDEAERKRLFYVACTRAREELHLFAAPDRSAKGEISVSPTSLLHTAWPVARAYFDDEEEALQRPVGAVLDLAAGADAGLALPEAVDRPPLLRRLPLGFDPQERFRQAAPLALAAVIDDPPGTGGFSRPEGSFAARAFGNAVHAFLELAARQIAEGARPGDLRAVVPGWLPRATAVLRAGGLAPAVVGRLAQRVIDALQTTLDDPHGRWILTAHPIAATEYALATEAGDGSGVRLDRIFRSGAFPAEHGDDFLWIVDYKTATHGAMGVEEFLAGERIKYQPQLEVYARAVARLASTRLASAQEQPPRGLRVALYYPALAQFTWWIPDLTA